MSVTFSERFKSRRTLEGPQPSVELIYLAIVAGEANEDLAIMAAAESTLPTTYDGKPRRTIEIEQETNELWIVTITYAYSSARFVLPVGGTSLSLSTVGGTRRLTQSLQTLATYAPPTLTAPDYKGAIGVSDSGVEGVDVPDRTFAFKVTKIYDADDVDATFIGTLYACSGKVNSSAVTIEGLAFAAGELRFDGAEATQRSEAEYEIVYSFVASPAATGQTVGDIVDIDKEGWDYLWILYGEETDDAANAVVRRPIAAYVERVIERADLNDLNL